MIAEPTASQNRHLSTVRRALQLAHAQNALDAIRELAHEDVTASGDWGDGYRAAQKDLRDVLAVFEQPQDRQQ